MISERALALAQTLVRMDTVSRNSNLELIHFVRDELLRLGVASRLTWNADKTKANLFATLGEGKPAGVILSGHTDTVPWDGQAWSLDPLSATVRDGRLYGRGSADMKAFIDIALAQAQHFLDSPAPFAIHLALSFDEEVGCLGVKELIADLRDAQIQPLACIVGEPTLMVPAIAHKGVYRYRCCVRGKEAHSSLTPQSVNAIEMAARLDGKLRDMAEGFERDEPRYAGFDVPYTTMTTNRISGGIAVNTIPEHCEFAYEFRNLPGMAPDDIQAQVEAYVQQDLLPRMRREFAEARIEFESLAGAPSFDSADTEAINVLVQALTGDREKRKVAYATEAGLFQQAGIPSVVCGPGAITEAHKANEYVELAQLARCEQFLRKLAQSL